MCHFRWEGAKGLIELTHRNVFNNHKITLKIIFLLRLFLRHIVLKTCEFYVNFLYFADTFLLRFLNTLGAM